MQLKSILFTIFFLSVVPSAFSQGVSAYVFTYDEAGNRTTRIKPNNVLLRKGVDKEEEVKQEVPEHFISIYPNPVKSYFDVKVSNLEHDSKTAISLIDLTGRPIFTTEGISELTTIDVSKQPNGVYFLQIIIDGHITDWKVIKED